MYWNLITNIILVSSLITVADFFVHGLYQWITRKSFKKVDCQLKAFIPPLILMAIVYFIFDKVWILNTRPDGSGEASFPSTHVMVVGTIFFITISALPKYIKNKTAILILDIILCVLISLTATGRILANKHWFSDVIAGLIFAMIFTIIYEIIIGRAKKKAKKNG